MKRKLSDVWWVVKDICEILLRLLAVGLVIAITLTPVLVVFVFVIRWMGVAI